MFNLLLVDDEKGVVNVFKCEFKDFNCGIIIIIFGWKVMFVLCE